MSGRRGLMHVAVVGAGSIGKRHLTNLAHLGVEHLSVVDTDVDRRQKAHGLVKCDSAASLHELPQGPIDAVVVAVPTYLHIPIALEATGFGGRMLIEKPLSHNLDGVDDLEAILAAHPRTWAVVGYSLRFHPALTIIKNLLDQQVIGKIFSVRAEVGQYLPDWHPTEDYRNWYMSKESQGGGALLDLSHELDYLQWLFGPIIECGGYVDKVSDLDMDSDDLVELVCKFRSGITGSIHLDLLQRAYHRGCRIIGYQGTIIWEDNADGVVKCYIGKEQQKHVYINNRNIQFLKEMEAFLLDDQSGTALCSFSDALHTLKMVLGIKKRRQAKDRVLA